jgi:membrane glycosyltransferase
MIVLDADSVMSGETMVRLAVALESAPDTALIQTMPIVADGRTAFARWQQFAARLYGPVSSAGLTWWSGAEATFWGHNAIIRTAAFADSCGLDRLPGRGPLSGDLLSHDMVEAALLRRAGWAVHMIALDEGSYESFPPTPIDHAVRDRRWCQGNLQHLRLLLVPGLHLVSRLQLLMGASTYLTSPLWLLLLLVALSSPNALGGAGLWEAGDEPSTWMISMTVMLLIGPKLMGLLWTLISAERRRSFGGTGAILAGVLGDIAIGLIFAPIVMVTQSLMLVDILRGRSSGWSAQRREVDRIGWREALARYDVHVWLGLPLTFGLAIVPNPPLALLPVAAGLLLAPAIAVITSSRAIGERLAAAGLFVIPEEAPRPIPVDRPTPAFDATSFTKPAAWSTLN